MKPKFHPPEAWHVAYAVGTLDRVREAFLATHLTYCPQCRAEVEFHESAAAQLLGHREVNAKSSKDDELWAKLAGELDLASPREDARGLASPQIRGASGEAFAVPQVLRSLIHGDIQWRKAASGLNFGDLERDTDSGVTLRLLELEVGGSIAPHRHAQAEFTLVLCGALQDSASAQTYLRGDFIQADDASEHAFELWGDEPCLCLYVAFGRIQMLA
jgi:putative transcriptional regulator